LRWPAVASTALDAYRHAEPIRGAELLLVEDNASNQEVARAILGKMGLRVTVANHGREALQLLADKRHDLVLMDLQMPVMDGFEATAAIRATAWGRDLPIIAMTAAAFADDRRRVLEAGMNDFVSKPVDPHQLLDVLLRWLPQRSPLALAVQPLAPSDLPQVPQLQTSQTSQTSPALPAQLEGFELAQTLERLGQDQDLLLLVMRQFLHDFDPDHWASEFDTACRQGQQVTALRLAHTLKGVAANLGAVRLQAAAAALEVELRTQAIPSGADPGRLQQGRNDCLAALRAATAVLQAGLPAPPTEDQTDALQPVQLTQARQDLAEAEQLLSRNRLLPAPLLARLREHLGSHAAARQLETLREQLGVFDFESALQTLNAMQDGLSP
jgi:two-component system sensor histidine kinase/response regulator